MKTAKRLFLPFRRENYGKSCQDTVLKPRKSLNIYLIKENDWTFQQNFAQAHNAKVTQWFLKQNASEFSKHKDWPSSCRDLNSLD
ncbi:hypothetical protein TNCV_2867791 [Trichonephila clavipes]|nr:hypothetical protein TNCV_2867791 [Trichonephila clavipes]